jgi:hypothetical protein
MVRGRPSKNYDANNDDIESFKKNDKCINLKDQDLNESVTVNHSDQSQNSDVKKRGRKKGRGRKDELDFKPEAVIDYMIRNFPYMGIEKIKHRVLDGLKTKRNMNDTPYMLCKFSHNGANHYHDDYGTILNADCMVVGYLVKNDDGSEKKYMIDIKKKDTRSYQEVIDQIESS